MTKSEFVDQVADRAGLSKKDAGDAVDAMLETIEGALRRGSEVTFSGFGKFSVSQRSAREGRNPATGEKIQIAASKRAEVHGRSRPQEGRQVAPQSSTERERVADGAATPGEVGARSAADGDRGFGDRLVRRVDERASQLVLGLDPDPMRLWPRALELAVEESSRPPGDPIDQAAGRDARRRPVRTPWRAEPRAPSPRTAGW